MLASSYLFEETAISSFANAANLSAIPNTILDGISSPSDLFSSRILLYDPSSAHSIHPLLIAIIQTGNKCVLNNFSLAYQRWGSERHVPRSSDPLPLSMAPPFFLGATDYMFNTPGF